MVKTNILDLLATLHNAGVRVNLLNNYDPATRTAKADATKQTVRFEQDSPYYKLPHYEISSAGNLNISFVLNGKAHDLTTDQRYDAINFKCISIVKNARLFKKTLDICPDDVELVKELGFDINGNEIDLTKFDLVDGLDGMTWDALAQALVERYVNESFKERSKRTAPEPWTPEEMRLVENGYNPRTKVWAPIVTSSVNMVKNHTTDYIGYGKINDQKSIPRIADILEKVSKHSKLSPQQQALYEVYKTGYKPTDNTQIVNTLKYALQMTGASFPKKPFNVELAGQNFKVEI